jgi:hypothetical protein
MSKFLFRGGHLDGQMLDVRPGPDGLPPVVMAQAPSDMVAIMRGPDDPAYEPDAPLQPIRYFKTAVAGGRTEYRVSDADWIRELERTIKHLEKRLGAR